MVAANLTALLAGALVWVGGAVLLARQAFGAHGSALAAAGLASASFTAMPFLIAGYGVLWPNLLGMAMVPALLGCVLSVVGGRASRRPSPRAAAPRRHRPGPVLRPSQLGRDAGPARLRRRRGRDPGLGSGADGGIQPRAALLAIAGLAAPPLLWVAAQSIHRVALVAQVHTDSPPDESLGRAVARRCSTTRASGRRSGSPRLSSWSAWSMRCAARGSDGWWRVAGHLAGLRRGGGGAGRRHPAGDRLLVQHASPAGGHHRRARRSAATLGLVQVSRAVHRLVRRRARRRTGGSDPWP